MPIRTLERLLARLASRRRLRRAARGFERTPGPLQSNDLARWAVSLCQTGAVEPPQSGVVFSIEQLELLAAGLAAGHTLAPGRRGDQLLDRLADSERTIARCTDLISAAQTEKKRLTPAADWLLDNQHLIDEQIQLIRKHFPRGYCRSLPKLADGPRAGSPRVYDLIHEFVAHVDGRVDEEALSRYLTAYQASSHLALGELWSVAIMLRLALVENLRRVALSISWQWAHRDCARRWVERIDAPSPNPENALLVLADMAREGPPLSTAFVSQFTQALQGREEPTAFVTAWLERRLAEGGRTIEDVIRAESQRLTAEQASMANSIRSLRLINATEWHRFVEAHSATEKILRAEPAGVYGRMDLPTRDQYRKVVEAIARRRGLDEEEVARTAVALAAEQHDQQPDDESAHVGYVLVDAGRHHLERALRGRSALPLTSRRLRRGLDLLAYLAPIALLTVAGAAWLASQSWWAAGLAGPLLALCAVLAASELGVSVTNWVASFVRKPRPLPRMDFERGIPDEYRTIVVVPTLLTAPDRVATLVENLELRYLANRDANLWFGLLTDFGDADREHLDGDEALLDLATEGIEGLNQKYTNGAHGRFFLLHRPRILNHQEGIWMGRERKRGKLEDFNALLGGHGQKRFCRIVGDSAQLASIRYVITLDTDTDLPWGAGWRLVGAAAHPLSQPKLDPSGKHMVCGYAILQPRVSISMRSAVQSHYSRLMAGDVGFDPYTRLVSDVYQDLFAEASFIGKGIYDVKAFRQLLEGRFPNNAVLSHDLLESCFARSRQCSDVELLEDSPSGYLADVSRRHRWIRGDWQISPWLGLRVSDATGHRTYPAIGALGRWKIFDNLRRSLVAPAYAILLVLGWFVVANPLAWTLAVLCLLFAPELLPGFVELGQRPAKLARRRHVASVLRATGRRLVKVTLWLTFLPFEATVAVDAAARALWRMLRSHRRLLEWQTAESLKHTATGSVGVLLRRMWVGPCLALVLAALLVATGEVQAALVAGPILLSWLLSPVVAWWVSQPLRPPSPTLDAGSVLFLRRVARLTWRYFETFIGPEDNWLPPDNFQEQPDHRIAHRTSPTDMGLALLSSLAAHDLGYVSCGQLLERTTRTVESMEQMDRYRGHFLNWYDTSNRQPLWPLYVSTVDSGNLVGHVRVLRSGLLELPAGPVLPAEMTDGLRDTLSALGEHGARSDARESLERLLAAPPEPLSARAGWLAELIEAATRLSGSFPSEEHPEAAWWASTFERHVRALAADLANVAPWLGAGSVEGEALRWRDETDGAESLQDLRARALQAAEALSRPDASDADLRLSEAFRLGAEHISSRFDEIETLAQRCLALTDADFSFLYDRTRKLLSIGFRITDHRPDESFYDLLASEARLASYVAIAGGQISFDHWFALGRHLTTVRGAPVLLSWSGSMFEYVMPLLVMPGYRDTLLEQTCNGAVARQIEYGRQHGVPWGISESCHSETDVEGTYQYRAFGVPGLGLQRGLGDDLVISPYASTLALLVDPSRACANLRRMAADDYLGSYGFYEAVDFAAPRARKGHRATVVATFMVHHQGMSLLALSQAVLGPRMQRRFLANPDFRAASLLLQERIPKPAVFVHPHARKARVSPRILGQPQEEVMRVIPDPNTPVPEVHLLSNGHYQVMVSAAGGGYSRWNDLALTRWREDPTSETCGIFCFIGDTRTRRYWSSAFQPTLAAADRYEAVFKSGRAEFRRRDDKVETHTEIAVAAEHDLEIRRLTLTNRSESPKSLLVTAYAELVLAPGITDELHPAFSNLFVHTEIVPGHSAILATRRSRAPEEKPPWMFCLLPAAGEEMGACSFETDRGRFIGRGHSVRQPLALEEWGPLSGSAGAVLDPCAALRRTVALAPGREAKLDLIIGAAPTREAALHLVSMYQDRRMADRVLEVEATHSRAVLSHIGVSEAQAQRYGQLAAALIFPAAPYRASRSILGRNRKGQSSLWAHGISGDLPIVLLRVTDASNLGLVRDLLGAHAYWRTQGLATDLVIWSEEASGYRGELGEQIRALIAIGTEASWVDKPGGVFVRALDGFPEEDRVLLQAVARIVVRDTDGPLGHQMERWRRSPLSALGPTPSPPQPSLPPPEKRAPTSTQDDLIFANGTGGFTQDGREYVIDLPPGRQTPAPWVNVIANPRFGTVVSERGSAYTWYGNAQLGRLTPWRNDTVTDSGGEALYVRDDASGRFFSPTPWPCPSTNAYKCRHGFGYSIFEHQEDGLRSELTTYVAVAAPVKFLVLKLKNLADRRRKISVFASVDLVLGDLRSRQAMHVVTEIDPLTGAILARNEYGPDFSSAVAFFDCSEATRDVTGDRAEFLGRNGDPSRPAALGLDHLSGRLGPALDPCAAMQVPLDLAPGAEQRIVFVLGAGDGKSEAIDLTRRHRGVGAARVALEEVWRFWNDKLGVIHAETPDTAMDVLFNGWLPYQVLSCRMWGRTGFYQSGGAFGFRDQLQDCVALLHEAPDVARQHLLTSAARLFVEGDAQHWWHPDSGRGVRTTCSDDYLWLAYAVCRYVTFTGDTGVLDEQLPYLTGRLLGEGEESHSDLPGRSEETETLYEHCVRAISNSTARGAHGLPLMGGGDWNDGMNRVGHLGQGESVWLGFFLHTVLSRFAILASRRGDEPFAARCREEAGALAGPIEEHAWDGQWYRRAFFDDGEPLGSARNEECQIDSLPQSWATIASVGAPERREQALDSLWERLVRQDLRVVPLLTPPFDHSAAEPGYIKGYPPGVRENGGQYSHAAVWAAWALALAGRTDQSAALVSLLNPINHALDPAAVERYKVEPYVMAADIYTSPPHEGRGGWTWYTGSAAWFYRLLHEVLFGMEREGDTLRFQPRVPASWEHFKLHYRYYETFYHIAFTQSATHRGPLRVTLDGRDQPGGLLRLIDDRKEHAVGVLFAPGG